MRTNQVVAPRGTPVTLGQMSHSVLCFAVGLSNFGVATEENRLRCERIRAALEGAEIPARLVGSFRATGNFALEVHGSLSPRALASCVGRAVSEVGNPPTPCAAVDADALSRYLDAAMGWAKAPESHHHSCGGRFRWTPGLAFLARGTAGPGYLDRETDKARLRRLTADAVAVHKRDCLRLGQHGLDPGRRLGGWGAISKEIGRDVGGEWTARSHTTVAGVLRMVSDG